MSNRSLAAIPLQGLGSRPDVIMAVAITAVIATLIVPLPSVALDLLITVNLTASLLVLMVALFARKALEVSSFPALLLFTTLLRLGLNVSTTRGILTRGEAGAMVKAFGHLIAGGDLVIGFVIFLVITLVQFLVVAKGSERVAEVGARFTLDAMPGHQMSIDAAARNGTITEEEAQHRREELARASQLFGNMDGAMKFVKGDTIAGLIMTAINIVAGVAVGVLRNDMSAGQALEVYAILTIGDGIVAQVASLLVTISAGVLVTRVESQDKTKNLGHSLRDELFGNEKALHIAAAVVGLLGLMPGVPFWPASLCSLGLSLVAARRLFLPKLRGIGGSAAVVDATAQQKAFKAKLEEKIQSAKGQKSISDNMAPSVIPINIEVDPQLSELLGFGHGKDDEVELISVYIPQLRDALFLDTGVRFPGVRIASHSSQLSPLTFSIRIEDVPVVTERLEPGMLMATTHPDNLTKLKVAAQPIQHPISRGTMSLIKEEDREVVEAAGITVWPLAGMLSLYLVAALRKRAKDFVGLQEVSELVERLEKAYPALVKEVIPKVVSLPQVVGILRRLVDEGVSIRNLKRIAEALGEHASREHDTLALSEAVRSALAPQIAHLHAANDGSLPAILLEPAIEDTIGAAIEVTTRGAVLSLEPEICKEIVRTVQLSLQPAVARGKRPVVLTATPIRRFVRKILEVELPQVAVLSYDELPPELVVQPLGRAALAA